MSHHSTQALPESEPVKIERKRTSKELKDLLFVDWCETELYCSIDANEPPCFPSDIIQPNEIDGLLRSTKKLRTGHQVLFFKSLKTVKTLMDICCLPDILYSRLSKRYKEINQ